MLWLHAYALGGSPFTISQFVDGQISNLVDCLVLITKQIHPIASLYKRLMLKNVTNRNNTPLEILPVTAHKKLLKLYTYLSSDQASICVGLVFTDVNSCH